MKSRLFASVAAIGLAALGLPHAAEAQVVQDQQAQAAPAPAAPAPAAPAAPAAPTSNAMASPAMGGTIAANPNPFNVDLGPWFGKAYVTGAVSGMAFGQSNHVPVEFGVNPPTLPDGFSGNNGFEADLTNGLAVVQKTDGTLQYFLLAGAYSLPTIGVPYINASHLNSATYGPVPEAYLKWAPTDSFSLEGGKLPTLIGEESMFTFENLNIERGLLWNQENLINKGVQGNYTWGPLAFALSWNDGFYSNHYTYVTGSATWTVDSANTIILAGGGNTDSSAYVHVQPVSFYQVTPEPAANEQQYDLSWTYTNGPWMFNPYVQYTHTPSITNIPGGIVLGNTINNGSTYGGAILASYTFDPAMMVGAMSLGGWSLDGRAEYISSTGHATATTAGPNLLGYGPGSKAWSLTITPTYQYKIFFGRLEASFIKASSITPGAGFGLTGTADTQFRGLVEVGLVF